MSEQKQLQEEAALARLGLLDKVKENAKSGTLDDAIMDVIERWADLITKIAGPPSVPLECLGAFASIEDKSDAVGAYASAEAKPEAESKA